MLIRGAAGTGKTTLLKAAARAIEERGRQVHVFAPTSEASRGVLRGEGFDKADTVARLLIDEKLQTQVRGGVIWVDEAGLLGTKDMKKLFAIADQQRARVVLMGDERQHGSVPRGEMFRLLQSHAGLPAAEVAGIQRQKGEYRAAVSAIADGNIEAGFAKLDRMGCIRESAGEERHRRLAEDYLAAGKQGTSALVVAPTHAEGREVTRRIREQLKENKQLAGPERTVTELTSHGLTEAMRQDPLNYAAGDVVRFQQNVKGGFRKGEAATVLGRNEQGQVTLRRNNGRTATLPLEQAKQFDVYERRDLPLMAGDRIRITQNGVSANGNRLLNGSLHTVRGFTPKGDIKLEGGQVVGKEYGHVAHGFCVTSHASQGKTVDRVLVSIGPESQVAANRQQFYVSVSRGRESVTIYTDDKQELRESVARNGERQSATEMTATAGPNAPQQARERHLRHAERTRHIRRAEQVCRQSPPQPQRQLAAPMRRRENGGYKR